ncbi:MAG: VCBS repeat-containing protein, partial [Saprospiraceae bacterium]|nr:VCBS repeat-containing protein [Saprospiraceae bacterium]
MVRLYFFVAMFILVNALMGQGQPLFQKVPSDHSNITFNNTIQDTKEHSILKYSNYYGGAGVAIGDLDNDGLQDLFFAGNLVNDRIYKNLGNLQFEDVVERSGIIQDSSWSSGVVFADVNNDGLLDIYVTCELYDDRADLRTNKLYINKGDFQFEEAGNQYGVDDTNRTRGATFFDYNNDGFLDLLLLNQPPNPGNYSKYAGKALLRKEWSPKLFVNIAGRYFKDVSQEAGIDIPSYPNAVVAADLNKDGWQDLYIANDYDSPDFLFINNQNGGFDNIANEALRHMSYYSMGVD